MSKRLFNVWFCTWAVSVIAVVGLFGTAAFGQSEGLSLITPTEFFEDPATPAMDINFLSDDGVPSSTVAPETETDRGQELNESCRVGSLSFEEPVKNVHERPISGSFDGGGFMFNGHHPNSKFNGPVTYDDRDQGQFNQLYMVGGLATGADSGWFGAFRYDLMFGNDYFF